MAAAHRVSSRRGYRRLILLLTWVVSFPMYAAAQSSETPVKVFVGSDGIIENFGDREAPYKGFLVLSNSDLPDGYNETRHHYTKTEYMVIFEKLVESTSLRVEVTESSVVQFFEPTKYDVEREFTVNGRVGRVLSYREHLTNREALVLYWLNPPMQRVSITVELGGAHPFSPDDVVSLLTAMRPATGVPALVNPFPKAKANWP